MFIETSLLLSLEEQKERREKIEFCLINAISSNDVGLSPIHVIYGDEN